MVLLVYEICCLLYLIFFNDYGKYIMFECMENEI